MSEGITLDEYIFLVRAAVDLEKLRKGDLIAMIEIVETLDQRAIRYSAALTAGKITRDDYGFLIASIEDLKKLKSF